MEQAKATQPDGRTLIGLLEEKKRHETVAWIFCNRHWKPRGTGSFLKRFLEQDKVVTLIHTKTNMRNAFHLIEVAIFVISAYCGLGSETDSSSLCKSINETLSVFKESPEFLRQALKNATDVYDDQNNKDNLNTLKASKGFVGGVSKSDLFSSGCSMIIQHLAQNVGISQGKSTNFFVYLPQISKKGEQHFFRSSCFLSNEWGNGESIDQGKKTVLNYSNELSDGGGSIFLYLAWNKS